MKFFFNKRHIVTCVCIFIVIQIPAQSLTSSQDSIFTERFGRLIFHPHVWLENTNSEKVQTWLQTQEAFKFSHFKKSDFKKINQKLRINITPSQYETERYIFQLQSKATVPPVLKVQSKLQVESHTTLIRCSDLKRSEYDFPDIENYWVSDSLNILVAAISHSGSDWLELLVMNIKRPDIKYILKGVIKPWISFQEKGFYYEHYDTPEDEVVSMRNNQKISYHRFGSDQSEDKLIFQNRDIESVRKFNFIKPKDSDRLYIYHPFKVNKEWHEAISVLDIRKNQTPRTILVYDSPVRLTFDFIYQEEDTTYFRTDMNSPTFQVLRVVTSGLNDYKTVIPGYKEVLDDVKYLGNGKMGLKYLNHGKYFGVIADKNGKSIIKFPAPSGTSIRFRRSKSAGYNYFDFSTFQFFAQTYEIDMSDKTISHYDGKKLTSGDTYEVITTKYLNKNGDKVPLFLVYASNKVSKNGNNPTMIRVYGGYGNIQEPRFQWDNHFFLKNGGILAVPGIRGSGSLGSQWALNGRGVQKQNTIDDIISAAEYLIDQNYTNANKLILQGGSHGGFAVAAAAIQRPDLFKGVIANAGAFDLIRSLHQSVGHAYLNRIEFGDPKDSVSFNSRLSLSPIHNLKSGTKYPSFLLLTGSNDTRVSPSNSYRFLATLNDSSSNDQNFLHVTHGGHAVATHPYEMLEIMSLKFKFLELLTGYKFWK